jgi:hypothetical protein
MVDVDTIWLDDFLELVDETLSGCLDTQHCINLNHIITVSLFAVDLEMRKALS